MQSSVWAMGKEKMGSSDTFFTSEFFDFNHDTTQMEDFDISKQYLNSQICEKSSILRHMSQQYFTQALQVHYKFCLRDSLLFWRKFNQKQKKQEALNPKNMTKVFLKVFYILNKKSRSKLEKSFVKITNFTKQHEMKTYQTPIVKGIKKLQDTFESFSAKYCYGNPTYALNLTYFSFKELKLFSKLVKNKQKLLNFIQLLQKITNHASMQQFENKLLSFGKLNDKIEILFGTLSLLVNPIKRIFFHKLKGFKFASNFILGELDESINYLESESTNKYPNNLIIRQPVENTQNMIFKKKGELVSTEIQLCLLNEDLGQKRISSSASDDYFSRADQNNFAEANKVADLKGSLTFSRELKRKSSSLEKKNKFKFKSIPAATPKKQPKQTYIQENLSLKHQNANQNSQYQLPRKDQTKIFNSHHINPNNSKINLKSLMVKSKPLQVQIMFQNSLNYTTKSKRMITTNQKISFTNPHKPNEINSSYPDYFDFYSFTQIPLDKKIKQAQNQLTLKQQNKKGFKLFKTIKSGKSNINSKQSQNQKLINFKSLEKAASNSSLHDLKHEYRFPISYKSNRNVESLPYYDTMRPKSNVPNQYHTNPYQSIQPHDEHNLRQNRIQRPYELTKNSSLTFKTNRPMKKIKSADKDIVINPIKNKKDKKSQKPHNTKSKRPKQIKSEFINPKQEAPNMYQKFENTILLSARSGKSVSQKNIMKNIGLKLNSKK